MRYFRSFVLIMLALTAVMPVEAAKKKKKSKSMSAAELRRYNQRRFDIHNIYVWGGVGYSGLVNSGVSMTDGINYEGEVSSKFLGGGGGLLGVGYEYNYKKFILSVGPEFRMFSSADRLSLQNPYRVDGLEYDQSKLYTFSDLKETQAVGQIMLPVLFGMQLDKWYWKAGAKVGYTLLGNYRQKGTMTAGIYDPEAYTPEWNTPMPNHYNTGARSWDSHGKNPFGLDITVSAEIGVRLDQLLGDEWRDNNENRDRPMRMRLAVFADYGIPNMSVRSNDAFARSLDANDIATNSWQGSEWGASKLNSLLVGVKFTWMLQMNKVREEKKQNGYLAVYTFDSKTNKTLPSTAVQVKNVETGRINKKATNSRGLLAKREPAGDFLISAQHQGYLSVADMRYSHSEDNDTARVGLRPEPIFRFVVTDAKTGKPLAATVEFADAVTGQTVMKIQSGTDGAKSMAKLPVDGQYKVRVEVPDYFSYSGTVADIDGEASYDLEPIIKKRAIILTNLFFATNETTILPESEPGLQDLYDLLSENPEVRIRITGHTDNVGSDEANQILSEGRANSVRQNMIERGIDASRIEAEGKGESEPIATNDTEEGRAQNRRVEFVIL